MSIPKENIEFQYGNRYIRTKPNTLPYLNIRQIVDHYKKYISHRLVPLDPRLIMTDNFNKYRWNLDEKFLVSIKVDGEGVILVYDRRADGYKSYFTNDTAHRIWTGLPVNDTIEKLLDHYKDETNNQSESIDFVIFAGELFAAPLNKGQPDFEGRGHVTDLLHVTRNPNSVEELYRVGFRVFDVIQVNGKQWLDLPYEDRLAFIRKIFPIFGQVAVIQAQYLQKNELSNFYHEKVDLGGAEGIILRNIGSNQGYKIKPIHDIDAVIIGYIEGQYDLKITPIMVDTILVALRYPNGDFQVLSQIGSGFSQDLRTKLLHQLNPVESEYLGVTHDGRAFRMVEPKIVVRVEYMDIITEHKVNDPIYQPCLVYDEDKKKWFPLPPSQFVKLISPRLNNLEPIREDKMPTIENVRIDQIINFIQSSTLNKKDQVILPLSQILVRFVFIKENMVRKFIVVKTNKSHKNEYVEYVLYYTNYSPNRLKPLQRQIRVTNDRKQIINMLKDWIISEMIGSTGNLIRGWSLYLKINNLNQKKSKN